VIAAPPVLAGAVKAIEADALPAVADSPVGAPGGEPGVTLTDADSVPPPTAFTARNLML
jgi:hypothetical protein